MSQFESADEFFRRSTTNFAHSTGISHRLYCFAEAEGDRVGKYSFEEYVVPEFGAALRCGFAGIQNCGTEELQASYAVGLATAQGGGGTT